MARVRLERVSKVFGGDRAAVRALDLDIADGEFVVLVGPSGCGKSTTLRLVAGLETPSAGRVFIDERDVTAVPPQHRDVAMVFQSYALYPHKTVRENLEFPLRVRRVAASKRAARVDEIASALGIGDQLHARPRQLSGGQRQRVALGRALVREAKAFLFDEPLSNLDASLRVETRAELARIHRRLGATMLYVTHDQEEAMTLGDRVAVMAGGAIVQAAPPVEVYRRPSTAFVARFIGSPAINLIPCKLQVADGRPHLTSAAFRLACGDAAPPDVPLLLGVRPNDIELTSTNDADALGRVDLIEPLGSAALAHVVLLDESAGAPVRVLTPEDARVAEGERVGLRFRRDRLHLFEATSGRRCDFGAETTSR